MARMGMDSLASYVLPTSVSAESSFFSRIQLRAYRRTDEAVVRELFDVSFPIHYDNRLYEAMAQNVYQDRELVSLVAEYVFEVCLRVACES